MQIKSITLIIISLFFYSECKAQNNENIEVYNNILSVIKKDCDFFMKTFRNIKRKNNCSFRVDTNIHHIDFHLHDSDFTKEYFGNLSSSVISDSVIAISIYQGKETKIKNFLRGYEQPILPNIKVNFSHVYANLVSATVIRYNKNMNHSQILIGKGVEYIFYIDKNNNIINTSRMVVQY